MSRLMARRGPDDHGYWQDAQGHVDLGFRRLAILDLSPTGHQPMLSRSGKSALVFNGEIYNFPELRSQLESAGHSFRSTGDTEVLLCALEHWGLDALPRLSGMFALAWFEIEERRLTLARDRAGIKPLYYAIDPGGRNLAFGSQYNQLLQAPWIGRAQLRQDVLSLYMRLQHIPAPWALHEGTFQLEPGAYLRLDSGGRRESGKFWSLPEQPEFDLSLDDGELLAETLDKAVERHRLADVPLGVFLSGGIDSALVTGVARSQTAEPLKAFTLGNPGWSQDEEPMARRYAEDLGVEHHVLTLGLESSLDLDAALDDVIAAQHEPFADFSILPTLLISRFAREHVKVALSGDGGDELFFGYERPRSLLKDGWAFRYPTALRRALYYAGRLGLGPRRSDVIVSPTPGLYYQSVNCRMRPPLADRIAPGLGPFPDDFHIYRSLPYTGELSLAHFSRSAEFHGQLQRGLKKVDMASMYHGLEVRVPLLDPEVIDLSLRFDPMASLGDGDRKRVLRRQLARHVPKDSIHRQKLGFSIPLADLFRTSLKGRVESTLLDGPLFPDGLFDRREVERMWQDHLCHRADHKWAIWTVLCLQWWAGAHLKPI